MAALLVAAQCLTLLLLGVMLINKHRSLLVELTLSRIEIQAADLAGTLRTGVLSGLRPDEMSKLDPLLQHLVASEPAIAGAEILGVDGGRARVVFADDPRRVGVELPPAEWQAMAVASSFQRSDASAAPTLTRAVRDGADEVVAGLRLRAATAPLAAAAAAMVDALWPRFAAALLAMVCGTLAALIGLRRHAGGRGLRRRVLIVALVATVAAGGTLAWTARNLFAEGLRPAVAAKVGGVVGLLAGKLERAAALGIPLEKLPRIDSYFAEIVTRHPELAAVRLNAADGRLLAQYGDSSGEWVERTAGSAILAAAGDARFVDRRLAELAVDIAIVLLVAMLVFRELLAALLGGLPGEATAGLSSVGLVRLQALRLPLFLFILTEELSRACLPLYLRSFAEQAGLRPEAAVGVPIAVYMACFALATPFAGGWADRWGAARVFAAGVALTVVGFAWMALAGAYWQLLPARASCACGYAMATIACQRQLIVLSGPGQRARGLALFVAAVSIAAICGSSLGGILADQFGFRPVLATSALLAALAWVAFRRMPLPVGDAEAGLSAAAPLHLAELLRLLRGRRFAALMLGSAIPAKIALAGLLFYLTPLLLQRLDYSPSAIGRALMAYFVLVAAFNPLASWLSDQYGWRQSLTIVGGALIGVGSLAGFSGLLSSEHALWLAIAALGVGTGLSAAPMQSLATRLGAETGATSVAVALRTLERLGSVIGPLWAGFWLANADGDAAMAAIGVTVVGGTLLCLGARERPAR